ncbi:hypothetical protein [Colwellia psychrerythraea]|nr:hypothetical protein [Colwellia psychrerythraea]
MISPVGIAPNANNRLLLNRVPTLIYFPLVQQAHKLNEIAISEK